MLAIDSSDLLPVVFLLVVGALAFAYLVQVRLDAGLWRMVNAWRVKVGAVAHPSAPREVLLTLIAEGEELAARCARKAKTDWMQWTGVASWSDEVQSIHETLRTVRLAADYIEDARN